MHRLVPKSIVCLREGYTRSRLFGDLTGGITVAIIALPLAMALGIASVPLNAANELAAIHPGLTPPAVGLFTAVVAGFLISAFGGSRVQVGGPTAAFIPIVARIAAEHGYEGLAVATLMAGFIVILMGLFRFGAMIKFIPYPVTTGFTAGIAITIIASQLKDFLGLHIADADGRAISVPPEFVPKLRLIAQHIHTIDPATALVGFGSLGLLIALRRILPRLPGAIAAVVLASAVCHFAGLDRSIGGTVETIGSRFGGMPHTLPAPHLPDLDWNLVRELIPSAITIAILCSIESLLSAVVSDGMTGNRHKSDCELVAQGLANVGSVLFFGLPATGAIARTVANIKNGGKTPLAGMLHAAILLGFMLVFADLAKLIPLSTLAAVLVIVAWNISEVRHFRALLKAPSSDILVLLSTFGLTVFTDLTIAVGVGMVLAAMLFMRRMAEVSNIAAIRNQLVNGDSEDNDDPDAISHKDVPHGVDVYEIDGPFFFGIADRLQDTLRQYERTPSVFILRMRKVPAIDATGLHALEEFHHSCKRHGTTLLLSGVHAQPLTAMVRAGLDDVIGVDHMFGTIDEALARARELVAPNSHERRE